MEGQSCTTISVTDKTRIKTRRAGGSSLDEGDVNSPVRMKLIRNQKLEYINPLDETE